MVGEVLVLAAELLVINVVTTASTTKHRPTTVPSEDMV
jgi:hypothetical protein